jgi:hypothetical protein
MKRTLTFILGILISHLASAQFVAKMQLKEPIKGLCSNDVYTLLPSFKGQKEPICPVSVEDITKRLNQEVTYLKDSSNYDDKGMVDIIINCKGEVVKCEIDNKTKNPILDQQIVSVFNTLGNWTPGKLNKRNVDCAKLWSFKIKDGKFILE